MIVEELDREATAAAWSFPYLKDKDIAEKMLVLESLDKGMTLSEIDRAQRWKPGSALGYWVQAMKDTPGVKKHIDDGLYKPNHF